VTDLHCLREVGVQLVVRAWSTHGGTERYCHGFAQWLVARGVRPRVWCQRVDLPPGAVDLQPLTPQGRGRVGRLGATVLAVGRMPRRGLRVGFLRAPHFDVLRAGGGAHAAAMRASGAWGVADRVERWVDRSALSTAGVVVANSQLAADHIRRDVVRPKDSVRVVRNGVDLERFHPLEAERDMKRVVFVGHGFARKGLETALRAVARLPGVRLDVVGADRRHQRYRRLARSLGVDGQVTFLGAVDDPAEVVRRAGALVLPTRYDPSANVVLEAMACGVPPVTTRYDGASEVLPMPWLVVDDPDDAVSVAHALRRALTEPDAGLRCRQAAEAWSRDASFAQFAEVLEAASARRVEVR